MNAYALNPIRTGILTLTALLTIEGMAASQTPLLDRICKQEALVEGGSPAALNVEITGLFLRSKAKDTAYSLKMNCRPNGTAKDLSASVMTFERNGNSIESVSKAVVIPQPREETDSVPLTVESDLESGKRLRIEMNIPTKTDFILCGPVYSSNRKELEEEMKRDRDINIDCGFASGSEGSDSEANPESLIVQLPKKSNVQVYFGHVPYAPTRFFLDGKALKFDQGTTVRLVPMLHGGPRETEFLSVIGKALKISKKMQLDPVDFADPDFDLQKVVSELQTLK